MGKNFFLQSHKENNVIKVVITDSFYAFRGVLQEIRYHTPPANYTQKFSKKQKIVLLPGIFSTWKAMKKLADFVSSNGYAVYIVKALGNEIKDIPTSATIVNEFILKNNLEDVVFLSHSKGGIIGKYFLKNFNEKNSVLGMVSIATPYMGTSLARYFPFKRIREFDTKSELIKSLEEDLSQNNKIISIYARRDEADTLGGYLEGAKENIELEVDGHIRIEFSDKLLNVLIGSIDRFSV